MARRRTTKVKVNTKLMVDVVSAGLIVRNLPKVINLVMPLDPMLSTVAAVGGGYAAGMMFKRPDLANAAIAIGIAQFVDPLIDDLLGGVIAGNTPALPMGISVSPPGGQEPAHPVSDFVHLNDWVNAPGRATQFGAYNGVYNVN